MLPLTTWFWYMILMLHSFFNSNNSSCMEKVTSTLNDEIWSLNHAITFMFQVRTRLWNVIAQSMGEIRAWTLIIYTVYLTDYAKTLECRRFRLSKFRFVDILVCRSFGFSTFRVVDVSVCPCFGCRCFGLSTFWQLIDIPTFWCGDVTR